MTERNSNRGFGSMNEQEQQDVSRKGGQSSGSERNESGNRGQQGSSGRGLGLGNEDTNQRVSREGNESINENREDTSGIGRKGGESSQSGGRRSSDR